MPFNRLVTGLRALIIFHANSPIEGVFESTVRVVEPNARIYTMTVTSLRNHARGGAAKRVDALTSLVAGAKLYTTRRK